MTNGVEYDCEPCNVSLDSLCSKCAEEEENNVPEILHCKCPVVKLVKGQMVTARSSFDQQYESLKRSNTLTGRIWRKRNLVLSLLLLIFLLWMVFMYGVILGATMCGTGKHCRANSIKILAKIFPQDTNKNVIGGIY